MYRQIGFHRDARDAAHDMDAKPKPHLVNLVSERFESGPVEGRRKPGRGTSQPDNA